MELLEIILTSNYDKCLHNTKDSNLIRGEIKSE